MNLKEVLEEELKMSRISDEGKANLNKVSKIITSEIEKRIRKNKIDASVFIGGSVAKGTIIKKDKQDIDIFVKFSSKYSEDEIKKKFRKIFRWFRVDGTKIKVKIIHGSRNYAKIIFKKSTNISVEVVPSVRIKKPEDARNVTDLSFFHINYVKEKLSGNKNLIDEIILAKSFCHAQKCYGAESYIRGFSGYALELLIIHYGDFVGFLDRIAKSSKKIIIDHEKLYRDDGEIIEIINPAKKESPIIVIDPTYKERNTTTSVSLETFQKFKKAARDFLQNPSLEFFQEKKIDKEKVRKIAKENKAEFSTILIKTNKQEGDIAGTKLKKFSRVFVELIKKDIEILDWDFEYFGGKSAEIYLIFKMRDEIINKGPMSNNKTAVEYFKKAHPVWYFDSNGRICANSHPAKNIKAAVKNFKRNNRRLIKQMSIKRLKIANEL